jgi:hypothetical protein
MGRVGDEDDLTEAEADEAFQRTQPIGNALHALAKVELVVAAVDEVDPDTAARLEQSRRAALGEAGG